MPVSNWWTVIDAAQQITGGPFLWDGSSDWSPPPGQRAVSTDPTSSGYSWPAETAPVTLTSLTARVAALETRLTAEARGVATLPAIGLLQTITQRVKLKTAMPSTAYTPSALLIGSPVIGNLAIQSATVVDRQNVDVAVKATVAINLGSASVLVFADAN